MALSHHHGHQSYYIVHDLLLQHIMREKGKDQIDGITNYIYIENFPTLATPSYTDLEQQTPTLPPCEKTVQHETTQTKATSSHLIKRTLHLYSK